MTPALRRWHVVRSQELPERRAALLQTRLLELGFAFSAASRRNSDGEYRHALATARAGLHLPGLRIRKSAPATSLRSLSVVGLPFPSQ
eukprot:scaffold20439_cov136-Isochrysis_galbana.AAC.8